MINMTLLTPHWKGRENMRKWKIDSQKELLNITYHCLALQCLTECLFLFYTRLPISEVLPTSSTCVLRQDQHSMQSHTSRPTPPSNLCCRGARVEIFDWVAPTGQIGESSIGWCWVNKGCIVWLQSLQSKALYWNPSKVVLDFCFSVHEQHSDFIQDSNSNLDQWVGLCIFVLHQLNTYLRYSTKLCKYPWGAKTRSLWRSVGVIQSKI